MARAWIEHDPPSRSRVVLGGLAAVGFVAALVAAAWSLAYRWRDELPDPLAIHFSATGAADGSATLGGTVRVTTGLGVAGVVLMLAVGTTLLARPRLLRGWLTGLAPLVALAPASLVLTLVPNRGVEQWYEAVFSGWEIALVVAVPAVAAGVAWFVSPRPARFSAVAPRVVPSAPVSVDRGPYVETQVVWWILGLGVVVAAACAALAIGLGPALVVVAGLVALPIGWLSVYRYRVDDDAVTIWFGPLGPLRRVVAVSEIEGAVVVDLRPTQWGGWGYRTNGRDWAVVLRSGPGCRLDLAGRRSLSVSSERPAAMAGRVNGAVTRYWGRR